MKIQPHPTKTSRGVIEIVPAILRNTFEKIEHDWNKVVHQVKHIQIDITDGIFAGDGSFRDIRNFKKLLLAEKSELHCMVHTPSNYVADIIDLNPARCVFHLESFSGSSELEHVYHNLREKTSTELALALNPETPIERLADYLKFIDYILFMGYNPGWANQPLNPLVFNKIRSAKKLWPEKKIEVDGHVAKDTIEQYVQAGADILCANTAIFAHGNPAENYKHLHLLAQAAV